MLILFGREAASRPYRKSRGNRPELPHGGLLDPALRVSHTLLRIANAGGSERGDLSDKDGSQCRVDPMEGERNTSGGGKD